VSLLRIAVTAGETGPVVALSGDADLSTVTELSEALTAQVAAGPRRLIVDISGLAFADSASIRVIVLAGRALRDQGGAMELANPQSAVARLLSLMGVDQMITMRD
jgi:anti-sigma B factor antagonist